MGKSYVYSDTYAVCSFQVSPNPQQLIESRNEISVTKGNSAVILTQVDKNVKVNFTCKVPINQLSAFISFGAGLMVVGAASVAAAAGASVGILSAIAVFTGPVGWGLLAFGVLAIGIGLYLYSPTASSINPCTGPLNDGYWIAYKQNVKFNDREAVTHASLLMCGTGGVVRPFLTEAAAKNACASMQVNNLAEITVNTFIAGLTGLFLPAAIFTNIGALLGGIALGTPVTWVLLWQHTEYMKSDSSLKGNTVYKTMNQPKPAEKSEDSTKSKSDKTYNERYIENSINDAKKGAWKNLKEMDDPSDTNDLLALYNFVNASKESWNFSKSIVAQQKIEQIRGFTSADIANDRYAQSVLKDVLYGKYPELLKDPELKKMVDSYTDKQGRLINKNKKLKAKFRNTALKSASNVTGRRFNNIFKLSGQGATFFLPFLANFFSERAKKKLSMATAGNAKTINSSRPLGR